MFVYLREELDPVLEHLVLRLELVHPLRRLLRLPTSLLARPETMLALASKLISINFYLDENLKEKYLFQLHFTFE